MRPAFFERNSLEFAQKLRVVEFVVRMFRVCETRREDAGTTVEIIDADSRVFRKGPFSKVFRLFDRFFTRVFAEGRAVFFYFDRVGNLRKSR